MQLIAAFIGIALLATGLERAGCVKPCRRVVDALRTVVVARHGKRLPVITRLFYRLTWLPYAAGARLFRSEIAARHISASMVRSRCSRWSES